MVAAAAQRFQTRDVVELLGISRRQLQYWAQTDLIRPSDRTPGGHGRYTFEDLVALKAAKRLIDAGVSVQGIRRSIAALRRVLPTVQQPAGRARPGGHGRCRAGFPRRSGVSTPHPGQEWIFAVAQLEREVEDWYHSVASLRGARRPRRIEQTQVRQRSA